MDWIAFVRERVGASSMPMSDLFSFELLDVHSGRVRARALPGSRHYNPFDVVQGGFAASVLDIALGLVSITVLPPASRAVSTIDLSVTYLRPIFDSTGWLDIEAATVHTGGTLIVAKASLSGGEKLFATAQSNSMIIRDSRE